MNNIVDKLEDRLLLKYPKPVEEKWYIDKTDCISDQIVFIASANSEARKFGDTLLSQGRAGSYLLECRDIEGIPTQDLNEVVEIAVLWHTSKNYEFKSQTSKNEYLTRAVASVLMQENCNALDLVAEYPDECAWYALQFLKNYK